MAYKTITEGSARLKVPKAEKISKAMGVFYNPAMGLNRDISVLLLSSVDKDNMQIADPLAATGVRSIRFLKELNKSKIKKIHINDCNKYSIISIRSNLALNKIQHNKNKKIVITNNDANLFLLNSTGFDYIDVDPFGSPNFLLDSACKRIARGGILAVTATDTSALSGTFPKACLRKYWAMPKRDAIMHEAGLRILIRKIQLVAAQYDKALFPVFSYSKDHYMRVFLKCEKGKDKVGDLLKMHDYFNGACPMWIGKLWDKKLTSTMHKNLINDKILNKNKALIKFLSVIKDESKISTVGFYDLHGICEKGKIRSLPKRDFIINKIKKAGYKASETHFKGEGVRSNIPCSKLVNLIKK